MTFRRKVDGLAGRIVHAGLSATALAAFSVVPAGAQPFAPVAAAEDREAEWLGLNQRVSAAAQRGDHAQSLELAMQSLALAEAVFGADHLNTIVSVNNLAVLYRTLGRYAEAEPFFLRLLAAQERLLGGDHPATIGTVNDLAVMYVDRGRHAEAEPLLLRALDVTRRVLGEDHRITLSAISNLAYLRVGQGRYAEAEPLHLQVLEARERLFGPDDADTLVAMTNLAFLYNSQERFAEAEPLYLRVLAARERLLGPEHPSALLAVNNLAALYDSAGRFAEAEPLHRRALATRERTLGPDHPDTLVSVNNLAFLYHAQGRDAEAEPLFVRALGLAERLQGPEHPVTLMTANNLAAAEAAQGRAAQAEPRLVRSLAASRRLVGATHPLVIATAEQLASLRLGSGDPAAALEPARLAVAGIRARRQALWSGTFAEAQRGREQNQAANRYALLADAAWAAADRDGRVALAPEAFAALQDAAAGTTSRAVVQMAVRHIADAAAAELGSLVRERDGLMARWAAVAEVYNAAVAGGGPQDEAQRRSLAAERAGIQARIDAIDAVLSRDFPEYFALVSPQALAPGEAQALLAPDEAILLVVPTRRGTHAMAIDSAGIEWVRSDWTRIEIDGAVGRLLGGIRTAMAGGDYAYDRRTAFDLFRQVVAPVASRLAGKRHVFVAASGSLTSLPFGVLVTEAPRGADDDPDALRATRWFADSHALVQLPSVQSLQFLRRFAPAASTRPGDGFAGFGNPLLVGPDGRPELCARSRGLTPVAASSIASGRTTRSGGMLASVGLLRSLCPLPHTADELENMRAALGAPPESVFAGARSTEHAFRTMDPGRARVILLATHGLVAGDLGAASEPGLVFTPPRQATEEDDGFLSASEVSSLRLDADWVILSACNTAAGDGTAGAPGLSGLARAFFYAGARNLLASHWPVADEASARLTVRTIAAMPGRSRAEALQRAMRETREDPEYPEWAHPGVWAPFSLIGDGAR